MINPLDAAKYFIVRAYEEEKDGDMTNMKLQKLLYYAQSLHLALYDAPLFTEEIQAWRYGPVCPSAYHYYCTYEGNQLPIPSDSSLSSIPAEIKELLEEVWAYFGVHGGPVLSDMTHEETPWQEARGDLPREAPSQEPLDIEEMKKLGKRKLTEIEATHPAYEPVMAAVLSEALSSDRLELIEEGGVRDWLESLLD
jgi:uncharacterized phage-associated protein